VYGIINQKNLVKIQIRTARKISDLIQIVLLAEIYRRRFSEILQCFVYWRSTVCWCVCVSRMSCTKHAEDVTIFKKDSEDLQPSKMKFSHFMGLYTALSLKCLDTVVYLPVIGVYSESYC